MGFPTKNDQLVEFSELQKHLGRYFGYFGCEKSS